MEGPTCSWTCLKTAPLSSLSAPRCLHTQTHLERKLACDACSHAANEEAGTALCREGTHGYFAPHKHDHLCALELKGRYCSPDYSTLALGKKKSALGKLQSNLGQLSRFFSQLLTFLHHQLQQTTHMPPLK